MSSFCFLMKKKANAIGESHRPLIRQKVVLQALSTGFCDKPLYVLIYVPGSLYVTVEQEDLGSPMVCSGEDGKWELIGVFEGYTGQCGNSTSLYTRVSTQLDFITEQIQRLQGM